MATSGKSMASPTPSPPRPPGSASPPACSSRSGLKIVKGRILVTCRDQIVLLNDLNGDGETDFYESFNSDAQVTNHFHEFAMGLQADEEGNLYYARSARHARPPLVPHHGTLLKVSADGSETRRSSPTASARPTASAATRMAPSSSPTRRATGTR